MKECSARYSKIESFGLVDGPGVRSIIFLNGCPLRCLYCHNPEMQEWETGELITPLEAYNKLIRYKDYWGSKGGVTVSGGEPLIHLDFLIELGKLLKKENISYVIDTSGYPFLNIPSYLIKFDELLKYVDLFLLDIKGIDNSLHKLITSKNNESILSLFSYLSNKNFPIWIRYVLVPGYTDKEKDLILTRDFISSLNNVKRVEVLPYHAFAIPKYQELNKEYLLKDVKSPTKEDVKRVEDILEVNKYN